MCRNYSKVANLKQERLSERNAKSVAFETTTPYVENSLGDDHFELLFERNFDLPRALFCGEDRGV